MNKDTFLRYTGNLLFAAGAILGFVFMVMMVWGDLEGYMYNSPLDPQASLTTLKCPVLITPKEGDQITIELHNPTEKDHERAIRVHITEGFVSLAREYKESVPIPAGGKVKLSWDITADDAAYGRFVLYRIYVHPKYPLPSLGATCGVFRVDTSTFSGDQLTYLMVSGFLIFSIAGFWLRSKFPTNTTEYRYTSNAMKALIVTEVLGNGLGYLGFWVLGLAGIICAILLMGIMIGHKLSR